MTSTLTEIWTKETVCGLCLAHSAAILHDIEALSNEITYIEALVKQLPWDSTPWNTIKRNIQGLDTPRFQKLLALLVSEAWVQVYGFFHWLKESVKLWNTNPYISIPENHIFFDVIFSSLQMFWNTTLVALKDKVAQWIVPDDDIWRYIQYSNELTTWVKDRARDILGNDNPK